MNLREADIDIALLGREQIAQKLEWMKQGGHISEYLVSWRGSAGQLDPNVTVWAEPRTDTIRRFIIRSLCGLVAHENIHMVADSEADHL